LRTTRLFHQVDPDGGSVDAGGAPPPEEAPSWGGPSEEEWNAVQQGLSYVIQNMPQTNGEQPEEQFDPFNENFGLSVRGYIDERLAPYNEMAHEMAMSEADERAKDILQDDATANGEFDLEVARLRADAMFPEFAARFGNTPKAAEEALHAAAQVQRDYEAGMAERALNREQNQLATLANARREPPVAGTAATGVHVTPNGGDEMDLVRKYFPPTRP